MESTDHCRSKRTFSTCHLMYENIILMIQHRAYYIEYAPCLDVGILCCKTVAVVEADDVAVFNVPNALSAGCGGRNFLRPSSVLGSFSLGSWCHLVGTGGGTATEFVVGFESKEIRAGFCLHTDDESPESDVGEVWACPGAAVVLEGLSNDPPADLLTPANGRCCSCSSLADAVGDGDFRVMFLSGC